MGRVKKKTKEFEKRRRRRREGIGEKRREEKEIPRTYHKLHAPFIVWRGARPIEVA
jgi:hypothetical protein